MEKLDFKNIREQGLLLFEYIRGSRLYNINTPESDEDHGGVFIAPNSQLLGLGTFSEKNRTFGYGIDYQDEVSNEKHDDTWWELGKFMNLVLSSNPTVLEALFVPDDKVIYEHPLFKEIRKHRDKFVTKACFMPFGGYAVSQIKKAQGQDKKIHWDMEEMERQTPLDYCYTYDGKQGSINIQKFLEDKGLRQDCCGLVNIPNMRDSYLLYYDFAQHLRLENTTIEHEREFDTPFYKTMYEHYEKIKNDKIAHLRNKIAELSTEPDGEIQKKIRKEYQEDLESLINTNIHNLLKDVAMRPFGGHCGIINNDETSNTIRLCSTQKGESPLCIMNYNQDAYGTHCRRYKEYEEWKRKRNKARYESNLAGEKSGDPDMKYDCKNMAHCFRLVQMCIEIANGEGVNLDRTNFDRDFLMDIRARKFGYTELNKRLVELKTKMDEACANSKLPDAIDAKIVNDLLIKTREEFFKNTNQSCCGECDFDKMFDKRVNYMLDKFQELQHKLGIINDSVMVTGSIALYYHGLLPHKDIHDIDVVIRGDEQLDRDLETVTKLCGDSTYFEQYDGRLEGIKHKPFIFRYEDVTMNIWVMDWKNQFDTNLKNNRGLWVATPKHIIDVKKMYNRPKDISDIMEISKKIIN